MKITMKSMIIAGLTAGVGMTVNTFAADVTVGADLSSAYVWRGITFNDGLVLQPSLDVAGPGGLGVNVWGNLDLDDYGGTLEEGNFSEVDLTISYAIPEELDAVDFGVGVIEYLFPDADGSTREVYGETDVDLGAGVGAGAFFTYDFDEVNDYYANVSLSYGRDISEELSVELSGLIGYAGSDFASGGKSGLHEYQVSLSSAYTVSEATELGAFIAYTDAADSDVLAETDVDVYGGVSAYYSF